MSVADDHINEKVWINMKNVKFASVIVFVVILFISALVAVFVSNRPLAKNVDMKVEQGSDISEVQTSNKVFLPVINIPERTLYGVESTSIRVAGGLDLLTAAGSTWIRRPAIWWPDVEKTEGVRNWNAPIIQSFDEELLNAARKGLQVIIVVRGTPSWAQARLGYECAPITRTKLSVFGDFMADIVGRYSVAPYNVKYYQIINEPDVDYHDVGTDHSSLRGCWADDTDPYFGGRYYGEMLEAVYPKMKAANPLAQVVVGGLLMDCDPSVLPVGTGKGCNVTPQLKHVKFLEGILIYAHAGKTGKDWFDGISFHAYDYYVPGTPTNVYSNKYWNSTAQTTGPTMLRKLEYLKGVLATYNASDKFIMNTEAALLCSCLIVDDHQRAKAFYISQIYPLAIKNNLVNSIWFRAMDDSDAQNKWNMGLINDDLTPRYAYTAYVASRNIIGQATYQRALSTADYGSGVTNIVGYSFLSRGRTVWAIWTTATTLKTITLSSLPTAAYDMYGKPIAVPSNKKINMQAPDQLFVYVVFGP
jgi:hypothetical protein